MPLCRVICTALISCIVDAHSSKPCCWKVVYRRNLKDIEGCERCFVENEWKPTRKIWSWTTSTLNSFIASYIVNIQANIDFKMKSIWRLKTIFQNYFFHSNACNDRLERAMNTFLKEGKLFSFLQECAKMLIWIFTLSIFRSLDLNESNTNWAFSNSTSLYIHGSQKTLLGARSFLFI